MLILKSMLMLTLMLMLMLMLTLYEKWKKIYQIITLEALYETIEDFYKFN